MDLDNTETGLSPLEEMFFNRWLERQSARKGKDMSLDLGNYDMRGLYKKLEGADLPPGHGTDRFKRPGHITFSDESIYSTPDHPGGEWRRDTGKHWSYMPSQDMMKDRSFEDLIDYFQRYEPNSDLYNPYKVGK